MPRVIGTAEICRALSGQGLSRREITEKFAFIMSFTVGFTVENLDVGPALGTMAIMQSAIEERDMERFLRAYSGCVQLLRKAEAT